MSLVLLFHHSSDIWELGHKVTFDGPNKLILINTDVTSIDVETDLYSDWKEWILIRDNMKYEAAMRSVGGDPTIEGQQIGSTFFLINDWRIKTWSGDHTLQVAGNLFVDGGGNPFVPADGDNNILVNTQRSNIIDTIISSGSIAFQNTATTFLERMDEIISRLPNSGALTDIDTNISAVKNVFLLKSTTALSGTRSQVFTSLSESNGFYDDMFVVITSGSGTSGSTSVTRKIDVYEQTSGAIYFDVDIPFDPSGSNITIIPGYNPSNGSMG